jgi:SAM-dependent MidA family methyltransferase
MTVAAFIDLALYDPELGYYARAAQRSGRAGDFFTSVDVGPAFGELLEIQLAEMASIITSHEPAPLLDLVEVGAGNGRLSADILRAAAAHHPALYRQIRLHLVEASAAARREQETVLGDLAQRLTTSAAEIPSSISGIVIANELLDAMPVHQVVMRDQLCEVYVDVTEGGALITREGPPSTPAIPAYLDRLGVVLEPGWQAEINLRAIEWMRDVASRLTRGFVILIDYGHPARELYSLSHATGTLTTFARHTAAGPEFNPGAPPWLQRPGDQDITSHVDFTSLRAVAEAAGLTTIGFLDQTYFLLGILGSPTAAHVRGSSERDRAIKTLVMPGGLGSTHKVLILGKDVDTPALIGCSFAMRVT